MEEEVAFSVLLPETQALRSQVELQTYGIRAYQQITELEKHVCLSQCLAVKEKRKGWRTCVKNEQLFIHERQGYTSCSFRIGLLKFNFLHHFWTRVRT